ncbi:hypothetical protein HYDPIDRAFT_168287 [Hydnomerulius pinastri MD-312]|uniref:Uncharacterized protein n=1 Tax=Hydnomerulius pinastri MD-312 TaxID=994086 RepID=A0A0C9WF31_9AGAM|nr:hypothetical protein HYDPIDRAFT_168287 [Hydnomerulius pinastri MD-312]
MAERLPPELWSHIFDLAADEDTIFYPGLQTSMAQSTWSKSVWGDWTVRTPQDTINIIQRRSYATKKSIITACKTWRRLGTEFLVRCLFFDDPTKLRDLCGILDRDSSLGWWARRLHITHFLSGRGPRMDDFETPLISILQQCPNLEIFIVDWPMSTAFGPIADTLGTYCHNLRTVHWHVPSELLSKVIWALDTLPNLVSVHVEFDAAVKESDAITLGSAQDVKLRLPNLQQLFLKGFCQDFLEQAIGWALPMLRSFSFNFGTSQHDVPDVVSFLAQHGTSLLFLDLNCIPALDVRTILDLCPILATFCFNLDWKITPAPNPDADPDHPEDEAMLPVTLANRPHAHIMHIGLHGCLYAFGVGYAAAYADADPVRTIMIHQTNDRNFKAITKATFPKLERVRVLSPTVLQDLNENNGPAETCFGRWERWWEMCTNMRVRLEDCSGGVLGNLPQDPEDEEYDSDELAEGEEYEYVTDEEVEEERSGSVSITELRQLLEECRRMSEEREEESPFQFFLTQPNGYMNNPR